MRLRLTLAEILSKFEAVYALYAAFCGVPRGFRALSLPLAFRARLQKSEHLIRGQRSQKACCSRKDPFSFPIQPHVADHLPKTTRSLCGKSGCFTSSRDDIFCAYRVHAINFTLQSSHGYSIIFMFMSLKIHTSVQQHHRI